MDFNTELVVSHAVEAGQFIQYIRAICDYGDRSELSLLRAIKQIKDMADQAGNEFEMMLAAMGSAITQSDQGADDARHGPDKTLPTASFHPAIAA